MTRIRVILGGMLLALMAIGVLARSGGPTKPISTVPVSMEINFKPTGLTSLIVEAELRIVYLNDLDTLFEEPVISEGMIVDTLSLRPGENVEFRLSASSGTGQPLYVGYDTVDVVSGATVMSTINMEPIVSMLRSSPLYQEISLAGEEQASIGVDIYNVSELFGAAFRIQFDADVLEFAGATAGDFLGNETLFFAASEDDYVAVTITMTQNELRDRKGASGSGRLATVLFNGLATGLTNLTFEIDRARLDDENGQSIPEMSQLVFETGQIVVGP